MIKGLYTRLVFIAFPCFWSFPGFCQEATDWLIDDSPFQATVEEYTDSLILTNGLVRRVFILSPNAATIAFDEVTTNKAMLRGVKPEAEVSINGMNYSIGGLKGQPNYAFLLPEWIPQLENDPQTWQFRKYTVSAPVAPFPWKRARHHQEGLSWPPEGIHLTMAYDPPEGSGLQNIEALIHYACYDGIPVIAKWVSLINHGTEKITIDSFTSEIIAAVEFGSSVENRAYNVAAPNIHVETDYAFASMDAADANHHVVHWLPDPDYETQVNYQKQTPCLLKVGPEIGPDQILEPQDTFLTYRTFVLLHDSDDRERQGLAVRRMYHKLAPWTTENPLMMHARFADWDRVKTAIDQAADVGFEMVILTFGSGFNIEDKNPDYLEKMRQYAAYARSRGVEIGGYSLLASRAISPDDDVALPEGKTPVFGHSPCLGSIWATEYFSTLYRFYATSGFILLEHDGSYPGDVCYSTEHPGHRGFADSRWNQYQVISSFYQWCRSRGVYLNIPDYYYLAGGNKCGMGYRETNWSLPRAQQVIHTRQNIYDGTWDKNVTMGWMFVPLTEYHGGGEAATIEPLEAHLDHYELMMASNLAAGVQACYRGPRLYDSERTREMVAGMVSWFKSHRAVLEGDLVHLRRADGADLDYWLMVNPENEEKGALIVFNPTDRMVTRSIRVPLYYTGLTLETEIYSEENVFGKYRLNRDFSIRMNVSVPAGGWKSYFFK